MREGPAREGVTRYWAIKLSGECRFGLSDEAVTPTCSRAFVDWTEAAHELGVTLVFRHFWCDLILEGHPDARALRGPDRTIEGLLRVGLVPNGIPVLQDSVLESAPWNRREAGERRRHRLVGTMLVLRLVEASERLGADGAGTGQGDYRGGGVLPQTRLPNLPTLPRSCDNGT